MPLFRCPQCGCVENTALGDYWNAKLDDNQERCSECHTGTWHGKFEKRPADGCLIDNHGFLWMPHEDIPTSVDIVGKVEPAA